MGKKNPVVLNGERFERVMSNLPPDQKNGNTAKIIMLVASVTDMPNTVEQDLTAESNTRQRNADEHHEMAEDLRVQAQTQDYLENKERDRKGVVDSLLDLLGVGKSSS